VLGQVLILHKVALTQTQNQKVQLLCHVKMALFLISHNSLQMLYLPEYKNN